MKYALVLKLFTKHLQISFLLTFFLVLIILTACGYEQNNLGDKISVISDTAKNAATDKFVVLKFMAENKPSTARLNTKYKDFNNKSDYPLSVFITISKSPTNKKVEVSQDSIQFNELEINILKGVSRFSTCYIGNTDMNTYRDLIFYIKSKDKKDFSSVMTGLKAQNAEIKSYTFEVDPTWEAISEFQTALK